MSGAEKGRTTHVALLRGINVGGKHRLPMAELREIFRQAGAGDVRTYIQSGNVVYRPEGAPAREIPGRVAAAVRERYGFEAPVTTRTAEELEEVAGNNPFLARGEDPKAQYVAFLQDLPDPALVDALDPDRSPGDELVVRGREIYLHCPDGVARTKLTVEYFDSQLRTTTTRRNWRTVGKLLEMVRGG